MCSLVVCLLCALCFVVRCRLLIEVCCSYLLRVVRCSLFVVGLFVVIACCYCGLLLFVVVSPLFVARVSLLVVCCLWFVVGCLLRGVVGGWLCLWLFVIRGYVW